jgi:hypothetical protein
VPYTCRECSGLVPDDETCPCLDPEPIERIPEEKLIPKLPAVLWVRQCPVCGNWDWADSGLEFEGVVAPEPPEETCLHSDWAGDEDVPMVNRRMIVTLAPADPEESE